MKDLESGQAGGEGLASAGAERASSPLHVQPRIIASQDYRKPGLCKGSRIEGRRGDFWYPGEISRVREDGNYDIYYDDDDDDDEQICIRKDHIRLRLVKGTVVKVDRSRYDESDNWKIGEISRVSGDASTFDIDYDDGGKEMQVDRDRIRLPAPALADVLKELDNEKKDWEEVEFDHKDCHYEPLTPDLYIRFRILPLIAFYKQRIPERTKIKSATQVIMIGGSVFVVILGFMDWTSWAAAVTIVTSSITAYMEFSGTDSKISRYSGAVHSLQELVQWWQTLPQIDRNVVVNIDRLILNCEEILSREQQAWKSTSQSAKMLKKASEAASGGGNDKEKEE